MQVQPQVTVCTLWLLRPASERALSKSGVGFGDTCFCMLIDFWGKRERWCHLQVCEPVAVSRGLVATSVFSCVGLCSSRLQGELFACRAKARGSESQWPRFKQADFPQSVGWFSFSYGTKHKCCFFKMPQWQSECISTHPFLSFLRPPALLHTWEFPLPLPETGSLPSYFPPGLKHALLWREFTHSLWGCTFVYNIKKKKSPFLYMCSVLSLKVT